MTFTWIKKPLCLGLSFAFVVGMLVGCGDNTEKTSSQASSRPNVVGDDSTVEANQASVAEGSIYSKEDWDPYASMPDSIKGQTVRFATWKYHNETEGAIAYANIQSDIGINVDTFYIAQGGYVKSLMDKMNSGDIPDVFLNNDAEAGFPLTLQIAQPINKCSTVDLEEPIWDQSMIDMGTIGGNIYLVNTVGTPWSGSNSVFYNKSLFNEYGFKTPEEYYEEGTWTWDNMLKCMKEVSQIGDEYIGGYVPAAYIAESAGAAFVQYDRVTNQFSNGTSDAKLHKAFEFYLTAKEQGLIGGNQDEFAKGKVGICMTGTFGLKATGYFGAMNPNDIGFTFLPSIDEDTPARVSSIYRQYGICANAPNANAAGYFLRYFLDPANYDLDNTFISKKAGNYYYTLINTNADEKYFNFTDSASVLIGKSMSHFTSQTVFKSSAAQISTDVMSVSNEVDQAVEQANELVQQKIKEFQ